MARRVLFHSDFYADLMRQLTWLAERGETRWIERLEMDLARVVELLDRYPAAGTIARQERSLVLRRVIFPSTPYLAWYVYDESRVVPEVMLVRLYHAHQHRPSPHPSRWLPDRRGQR